MRIQGNEYDFNKKELWEVVRDILDENPRNRDSFQIAHHFGVGRRTVQKWGESPETGGNEFPLRKHIVSFTLFTGDDRLIGWVAWHCGFLIIPRQKTKDTASLLRGLLKLPIDSGQIIDEIVRAVADGVITAAEASRISSSVTAQIIELRKIEQGILQAVEQGGKCHV